MYTVLIYFFGSGVRDSIFKLTSATTALDCHTFLLPAFFMTVIFIYNWQLSWCFLKYYYQYYHGVFQYYYQYYHSVFKLGTIIVFLSTFRMLSMRADRNMFFFLRYSILQYINKVTVLMSLSVHKLSTVQWFLPVWCQ